MTARHDLARTTYQAERDIDRLFRPLAPAIELATRKHAVDTPDGPRIDETARGAILATVDRLLDTVFPDAPGARSDLEAVIVRRSNEARMKAITAETKTMAAALANAPDVSEAIT